MWNRLIQATGIASADSEEQQQQSSGSSISRELQEQLEQQQVLIAQLKHLMRDNEEQLKLKEKELEENHSKFQKLKLQSKAKITQLTGQIKGQKGKENEDAAEETTDVDSSRGKVLMLKKQLEESRSKYEKEKKEMNDSKTILESMVEKLHEQLQEKSKESKEEDNSSSQSSVQPNKDAQEMYAQMVYKDSKILELNNQIMENERKIIDLQETIREKDEVLSTRNKAIQLMSEDLTRRGKSVVDELDDVRSAMKQMQQNFAESEDKWKQEKVVLEETLNSEREKHELEKQEKDRNINVLEDAIKKLETARFDLSARNAELQEKVVLQQEKLEHWKEEYRQSSEKELLDLKSQLEEKTKKLTEMKSTLKEASSSTDTKVLKARVKERSRAKGLERQLQDLQKKDADQLIALERKVAELEEEKGSRLLKLMELEDLNKSMETSSGGNGNALTTLSEVQQKLALREEENLKLQKQLTDANEHFERQQKDAEILESEKIKVIEELQTSLKLAQDERVASELKMIELEEQKESEENTKQELKNEIELLRATLDQGSIPVLEIEKEKEALEIRCQQLQSELIAQSEVVTQHESTISEITLSLNDRYESLQRDKEKCDEELQSKTEELKLQETVVNKFRDRLNNAFVDVERLSEERTLLRDEIDKILSNCSVENTHDLLEKWNFQLQKEIDFGEELQIKNSELSHMMQIHSDLQHQADEAKITADEISKLKAELNSRSDEMEQLLKLKADLQKELKDLKDEVSERNSFVEQLKNENIEKAETIAGLQRNLLEETEKYATELMEKNRINADLHSELGEVQKERDVLRDMQSLEGQKTETKMFSLLQQIQDLEAALSETQDTLASKENLLANAHVEFEVLQSQNISLRDEIATLDASFKEIKTEFELASKEKEQNFINAMDQLNNDLATTKAELTDAIAIKEKLESELELKLNESSQKEEKLSLLTEEKCTLELEYSSLAEKFANLQLENAALDDIQCKSSTELSILQNEIANLRSELEVPISEKHSLEKQVKDLTASNETLHQSYKSSLDEISELNSIKDKLLLEVSEKNTVIQQSQHTIREISDETENRLLVCQEKLTVLEQELNDKNKALENYHVKFQDREVAAEVVAREAQAHIHRLLDEKELQKSEFDQSISEAEQKLSSSEKFFCFLEIQFEQLNNAIQSASSSESNLDKKLKESCNELFKIASGLEQSNEVAISLAEIQQQEMLPKDSNASGDCLEIEEQLPNLSGEHLNLLKQILHLTTNVTNLESTLQSKTSQLGHLNHIFSGIGRETDVLQNRLEIGQGSWEKEKQLLMEENNRLGTLVHEMTTNSQILSTNVQESEEMTKRLQEELDTIRIDFQNTEEHMEMEVQSASERTSLLESTNSSLKADLEVATQQSNELRDEKKVLKESRDLLQKEFEQLNREHQNVRNDLETIERDMSKLAKDREALEASLLSCQQEMTTDAVDLQEARLKCNTLEHVIEGLEKRCSESEAAANTQNLEIERLQFFETEYHQTVARVSELREENMMQRSQTEEYSRQTNEYVSLERELRAEIADLESRISFLNSDFTAANENVTALTLELNDKNAQCEGLTETVTKMEAELTNLYDEKCKLSSDNEELNNKLIEMGKSEENFVQIITSAKSELGSILMQKTDLELRLHEVTAAKETQSNLENEFSKTTENLKTSENLVSELQASLAEKERESDSIRLQVVNLNNDLCTKDDENLRLSSELKNVIEELQSLSNQNESVLVELKTKDSLISSIQEDSDARTVRVEALSKELLTVNEQLQSLQTEHQNIIEELCHKENYITEVATLREEKDVLRSQVEAGKAKTGKMLLKLKAFKDRNDTLVAELDKLKSATPSQERIAALQDIKDELEEKNACYKVDMENFSDVINQLKIENARLQESIEKNEARVEDSKEVGLLLERLKVEKEMLQNEYENSKDSLMETKNASHQLQIEKDGLKQELSMLREQAEMLVSDNETFQRVVEDLKKAKKNIEAELSKLKKNIEQGSKDQVVKIKQLEALLDEGRLEISKLEDQLSVMTKSYQDLKTDIDNVDAVKEKQFKDKLTSLSEENNKTMKDLSSCIDATENENSELRKELQELNLKNNQLHESNLQSRDTVEALQAQLEHLHSHDDKQKVEHLVMVQKSDENKLIHSKEIAILNERTSELENTVSNLTRQKDELEVRNQTLLNDLENVSHSHKDMEKKIYEYHQQLGENEAALTELRQKCVAELQAKQNLHSILYDKEKDVEQWTRELSSVSKAKTHFERLYKQLLIEKQKLEQELENAMSSECQKQNQSLTLELQQAMQNFHQQGLRCEQLNMEVSKLLEEKTALHQQLMQLQRHDRYSPTEQHNLSAVSTPSDHFKDISLQLEDEPFTEKQQWPNLEDQLRDLQKKLAESERIREELQKSNEVLDGVIQREQTRRSLVEEELNYAKKQMVTDTRSPSKHEYHLLMEEEPEMILQTDYSISKARKVQTHAHRLHRWCVRRKNYCSHLLRRRSRLHLVFCVYLLAIHAWLLALMF